MPVQEIPQHPILSREFMLEVAAGRVDDAQVFVIPGYKKNISASVLDDLSSMSTTIVPMPTDADPDGIQMEFVSTSVEDTMTTGTGVWEIEVTYLDINWQIQEEYVELAGTTPVNTIATDIKRVLWVHSNQVGSVGTAVGNISLRNTAGTVTYEYLNANGNQSLTSHFTVPAGYDGYLLGWECHAIKKETVIRLRATVDRWERRVIPGVFLFQDSKTLVTGSSGWIDWGAPLFCPELTDIKISAVGDIAGADAGGTFSVMIIKTENGFV